MSLHRQNPSTAELYIPLIDPVSKGGLVQVPVSKTQDTKGRSEYLRGLLKKEVSLCCLFQRGRCNAGDKCHQIHVDQDFIRCVREQQQHIVSCCRRCGDTYSVAGPAISFFANHFPSSTVSVVRLLTPEGTLTGPITPDQLAWTVGLQQAAESNAIVRQAGGAVLLPAKKVCRLHLRGSCKYGKDCKNIHLCSQLGEGYLHTVVAQPASAPIVSVAVAPRLAQPQPAAVHHHQRTNSFPAKTSSLFDRMSEQPTAGSPRSNSAPPLSTFTALAPVPEPATDDEPRLSAELMGSFGANVRSLQLCFDPELLAEACAAANDRSRRMSNATVDWDNSFDGGLSSTSSARSQQGGFFDGQQHWTIATKW